MFCLSYLECGFGNVVVNMAGFEEFHEGKGDDKADHRPFEASQSEVEHPGKP